MPLLPVDRAPWPHGDSHLEKKRLRLAETRALALLDAIQGDDAGNTGANVGNGGEEDKVVGDRPYALRPVEGDEYEENADQGQSPPDPLQGRENMALLNAEGHLGRQRPCR